MTQPTPLAPVPTVIAHRYYEDTASNRFHWPATECPACCWEMGFQTGMRIGLSNNMERN